MLLTYNSIPHPGVSKWSLETATDKAVGKKDHLAGLEEFQSKYIQNKTHVNPLFTTTMFQTIPFRCQDNSTTLRQF